LKDIGFITSGDGAQLQCYRDYQAYLDAELYLRTLDKVDLTGFRAIVVPDFSNQDLLRRHARQLNDYLAGGGFLIVFEPNRMDEWLDVVEVQWFSRETEDWNGGCGREGAWRRISRGPSIPWPGLFPLRICAGIFSVPSGCRRRQRRSSISTTTKVACSMIRLSPAADG
jgi:hypothetical protein